MRLWCRRQHGRAAPMEWHDSAVADLVIPQDRLSLAAQPLAVEAQTVLAHLLHWNACVALHDDEFAARIASATELYLALEVARVPHGAVLGKNLRILEVTRIPMDVIIEKVALAFSDAGVERVLGPGDLTELTQEAK